MSKYHNRKRDNRAEFKNVNRVMELLDDLAKESGKKPVKSKSDTKEKRQRAKQASKAKTGEPGPTEQVQQAETKPQQIEPPKSTPVATQTKPPEPVEVVVRRGLVDHFEGIRSSTGARGKPATQRAPANTKHKAGENGRRIVAFTISHGPIWAQLLLALQNPFYREIKRGEVVEAIIPPETVTFMVRRREFRSPDCDPATIRDISEEFNLTTTIEAINHRRSQDLLVLKGRVTNIMGISQNHAVEIFYRTDARCGAIISSSTHVTQKFHVPKNLGY